MDQSHVLSTTSLGYCLLVCWPPPPTHPPISTFHLVLCPSHFSSSSFHFSLLATNLSLLPSPCSFLIYGLSCSLSLSFSPPFPFFFFLFTEMSGQLMRHNLNPPLRPFLMENQQKKKRGENWGRPHLTSKLNIFLSSPR